MTVKDEGAICGLCGIRKGKTVRRNDLEFTCCKPCAERFPPDKFLAHAVLACEKRGMLKRIT